MKYAKTIVQLLGITPEEYAELAYSDNVSLLYLKIETAKITAAKIIDKEKLKDEDDYDPLGENWYYWDSIGKEKTDAPLTERQINWELKLLNMFTRELLTKFIVGAESLNRIKDWQKLQCIADIRWYEKKV